MWFDRELFDRWEWRLDCRDERELRESRELRELREPIEAFLGVLRRDERWEPREPSRPRSDPDFDFERCPSLRPWPVDMRESRDPPDRLEWDLPDLEPPCFLSLEDELCFDEREGLLWS